MGPANGLDQAGVASCDNTITVPASTLERPIGYLMAAQEAIRAASTFFDLVGG